MQYVILFILGFLVGAYIEWKFGQQFSGDNALLHEKLDAIKSAVTKI